MSKYILEELEKLYKHVTYYNNMSPFPVYDTEYVDEIKKVMDKIKEKEEDYDSLPVVACKHCKSLHITVDEEDNSICMKCNTINELITYDNIYAYKAEKNIWED